MYPAPIIFPHVQLPPTKSLWVEAIHWANDVLNHTATTANPGNKSPHEMWYETAVHASPHPFLCPAYCRWKRPSKSFPRAERCFYLWPGIDHPSDYLRMLTRATLRAGAPSPPLPEMPEQGGTMELGEAPEPGRTDDFLPPGRLHCRYWREEFLTNPTPCGVSDDANWRRCSSRKCGSERFINGQQRTARQRHLTSGQERCVIL